EAGGHPRRGRGSVRVAVVGPVEHGDTAGGLVDGDPRVELAAGGVLHVAGGAGGGPSGPAVVGITEVHVGVDAGNLVDPGDVGPAVVGAAAAVDVDGGGVVNAPAGLRRDRERAQVGGEFPHRDRGVPTTRAPQAVRLLPDLDRAVAVAL